jgi:hypothetical protein
MLPGNRMVGPRRGVRALVALAAVTAFLGAAVALARSGGEPSLEERVPVTASKQAAGMADEALPVRPIFIEKPEAISVQTEVQFRFNVPPKGPPPQVDAGKAPAPTKPRRRFQCRYDGGEWRACGSPLRLGAVPVGEHGLAVRALTRSGRPGAVASYSWQQLDPKPIAISASDPVEDLYPGFPPQPLAVTVSNPNDVPVEVTKLTVGLAAAPPSCPAENFRLTPSTASPSSPLPVPAGGSVTLPSAAAPKIEMLNLAVNQDACSEAKIDLVFEGEAHG